MKSNDGGLRHFVIAFIIAVVVYVFGFYWIEHRRVAKQPWEVTFVQRTNEPPFLAITQPDLGLDSVRVVFDEAEASTNAFEQKLLFNTAQSVPFEVPFGKCIFLDTTFLPGTVTLQCFGHEIEMIPRVLIVDHQENPWQSGMTIRVRPLVGSK